jgi:predicted dehydrogenase
MSRYDRRQFLKGAAAGGLAAATLRITSAKAFDKAIGANDRIRVAIAGTGGRAMGHIREFLSAKNVEIVYLVDPDHRTYGSHTEMVKQISGKTPEYYEDLRKVLEDKDIDVVSVASTNHWHSLLAIWAIQAGKDVYVEKPCSHNVFEGRKLVEAARKYNRIVQHGTQSRSDPLWIKEVAAVRSGKYGKLLISYGYASKPRGGIGFRQPQDPPKELNFDLWLGPAPKQPYRQNLLPYNWHWFWDFGNGEIGNQGVHQMDIARWAMPDDAAPQSVISLGGRFGYKDQGQTPNTQLTLIDFGGPKLFFEDRGLVDGKTAKVTNEFYMEEGVIKDGKFFPKGKSKGEPVMSAAPDGSPTVPHVGNFIQCVRNRTPEKLNAPILEGHRSSLLSHLANVSYRLGKDVPFSQESKAFGDDKAAYEAFESMKDHLVHAAKLKVEDATYRLGRQLTFDAKSEQFVGDPEANQLLTRPYRRPYVVPEEV